MNYRALAMFFRPLAFVAAATVLALSAGAARAQTYPGPNAAGYVASHIAFNWRDMTGADSVVGGDDSFASVTLPFTFTLAGTAYNNLWISTNGIAGFDLSNQDVYCCEGDHTIAATVAPAHMDWISDVTAKTTGSPGSQSLVIEWNGHDYDENTSLLAMQLVLHEGSNDIEFQYSTLTNTYNRAFIGLGGSDALGYYANTYDALNNYLGPVTMVHQGILISVPAVPEPESYALMLAGLGLVSAAVRRRRVSIV
jgi:hypothetical protein